MLDLATTPRRVLLLMLLGVGCSSPITQYASTGVSPAADLVEGRPAEVLLEDGPVLKFARVRLLGDTLYGWNFPSGVGTEDSVAVPVSRLRTIQQEHLDVEGSLQAVVSVAAVIAVALFGILALLGASYKT